MIIIEVFFAIILLGLTLSLYSLPFFILYWCFIAFKQYFFDKTRIEYYTGNITTNKYRIKFIKSYIEKKETFPILDLGGYDYLPVIQVNITNKTSETLILRFLGSKDTPYGYGHKDITLKAFESITDDICYCDLVYGKKNERLINVIKVTII